MNLHVGFRNTSIVPFVLNLSASGKLHGPGVLTLGNKFCTNLIGGLINPRVGLDILEKRKIP